MTTRRSVVLGCGSYLPNQVLTNADLARKVDTSDEWIVQRTGIHERRIAAAGELTSDMATRAARAALAHAHVDPQSIDLIVLATSTPDNTFPASAVSVQANLGITGGAAFDLQAVCSGFVYGLTVADGLLRSGAHKRALVIGAETFSRILDWNDRTTCVLFGDGGGAVLLEPAEEGEVGFIDAVNEIDGSGGVSLNLKGGGSLNPPTHETVDKKMHYIYQDGPAVYKFAVRKMAEATAKLLERNGVKGSDLGCFIPHQANKRIITATADRLGMEPERVIINIEKYGNTSAGTIPLAMETAVQQGKLKKGDLVLLAAVGAGFTVGTVLLRWEI